MNTRTPLIASALLAASLISGAAHAALEGRDLNGSIDSFEAYYDTDLNITWLAGANYGAGSNYDDIGIDGGTTTDGLMTWANAIDWAANLSFTDGVNVYDNWRLPTVTPVNGLSFTSSTLSFDGSTDFGYNISEQGTVYAGSTSSEMAHFYYNTLDNKGYCPPASENCHPTPQAGWGLTNTGPFANLQADGYWSATEQDWRSADFALGFSFGYGTQYGSGKLDSQYALAVSPGDVGAVPEPETWAMLLAGLGLVGVVTWRRKLAKV